MIKKELRRFIFIGSLAAATNFFLVWALVQLGHLTPLLANFFSFLIAFQVSYFGHQKITFSHTSSPHYRALPLFFITACTGLAINEIIYAFLLHILKINYLIAIIITMLLVSIYTFLLSKVFIFKK